MLRWLAPTLVVAIAFTAVAAPPRQADQIPPATALPLSEIVRVVEAEGHTVIPAITFDEGVWNFRVYKRGLEFDIQVDPVSAEILGIRPR